MASGHLRCLSPPDDITVNVRFMSHQSSYQLQRCSTVGQLRKRLAADHRVPTPELKILLGGQMLDDDLTIEDSGVGMESMLFAIQRKSSPPSMSPMSTATATTMTASNSQPLRTTASFTERDSCTSQTEKCVRDLQNQYYVYCKLCGEIRPGRLRVKCSVCEGGAVLVDKGPGSWEDVLTPGKVTGTCQSLHCEACVPVFYFKCAEHHMGNVSGTVAALHHIMPNRRAVLCITCEDVMNPVVVFPCQQGHVMCVGCFVSYCSVRLKERGFIHSAQYGYTLPCPAGCPDSCIQEQHHFCVLGREEYDRYKDFAAEECLLAEGGVYCPRDTCGSGFLLDSNDTRVICPHCKFIFCLTCRRPAHPDDCSPVTQSTHNPQQEFSDPERAERARWERQTADTIQQTTKACPGCGTRTERDGGCMHMRCVRCSEEWCWLCHKPWDRQCQGAHWFG